MQTSRIRVRKKGQVTLPQELRDRWGISEGSEIALVAEEDHAVIRPIKKTRIKEDAGSLGQADNDEVEFAIIDPELVSEHYSKKYRH
ncbi:MAG: AbrB/MazE/SpoVT family DNA-binding domain-containing protein [Nitrososphaerales archaeon]